MRQFFCCFKWILVLALAVPAFAVDQKKEAQPAPKDAKPADADPKKPTEPKKEDKPNAQKPADPKKDAKPESKDKKDKDADDTTKPDKPDPKEKPQPKEKVLTLGSFVGTVDRLETAQRSFILRVSVGKATQEIPVQVADDAKIRNYNPPLEFDDKGRPKRFTSKELKALRGPDPKVPGYPSDFDNLHNGQVVQLSLFKKKDAAPAKPAVKKKKGDDEEETPQPNKPYATLIVILREPPKN